MIVLILLIAFVIIVEEILYDHACWRKGLDDKPVSTIVRVIAFIVFSPVLVVMYPTPELWYGFNLLTAGLFLFGTHLLFFDFSLNLTRKGKGFFYHKKGEIWYGIPPIGELFIKAVLAWAFWIAFFHWNWIQGDFPETLIEFFMF